MSVARVCPTHAGTLKYCMSGTRYICRFTKLQDSAKRVLLYPTTQYKMAVEGVGLNVAKSWLT